MALRLRAAEGVWGWDVSDDEYERSLAYVAGMREAAKILRSCELYTIGIHDPDDAVAWHRRSIAQRIEREAARLDGRWTSQGLQPWPRELPGPTFGGQEMKELHDA